MSFFPEQEQSIQEEIQEEMLLTPELTELEYYRAKSEQSDEVIAYMQKQQAIKNQDHFHLLKENTDLREKLAKKEKEIEELRGLLSNASQRTVSLLNDFEKVLTFKRLTIGILDVSGKKIAEYGYPGEICYALNEALYYYTFKLITVCADTDIAVDLKGCDLLLVPDFYSDLMIELNDASAHRLTNISEFEKHILTRRIFVELTNSESRRKEIVGNGELFLFLEPLRPDDLKHSRTGFEVSGMDVEGQNKETYNSLCEIFLEIQINNTKI